MNEQFQMENYKLDFQIFIHCTKNCVETQLKNIFFYFVEIHLNKQKQVITFGINTIFTNSEIIL